MKSDRHLDIMRVNIAFLFGATYYQHAPQAFSSMKADVTFHSKPDESKNHHPPSFLLPSPGELFPSEKSSTSSSARFLSLSLSLSFRILFVRAILRKRVFLVLLPCWWKRSSTIQRHAFHREGKAFFEPLPVPTKVSPLRFLKANEDKLVVEILLACPLPVLTCELFIINKKQLG